MLSKSLIQSFLLGIIVVLGILITPNLAKGQIQSFEEVYSKVIEVKGDIIRLSGGITIDISDAKFTNRFGLIDKPTISVGNNISVNGITVVATGTGTLIKATRAIVSTGKEFSYLGVAQNTSSKTITIFNKELEVDSKTSLINQKGKTVKLKSIKPGSLIDLFGVALTDKVVAERIIKSTEKSPKGQLTGFIKSINGTKIELEGGFLVDIDKILKQITDPDDFFKNPKIFTSGTEIIVGLLDETALALPSGVVAIDGAFGLAKAPITIDGKLQAVDLAENTITVLGQKITLPNDVIIEVRGKRVNLAGLLVGSTLNIRADLNDNQVVPKLITTFSSFTISR
jgi:hypothetical protein